MRIFMNKKSLGEKIKAVRKAKKLTQAQLAELSGTNEKHISKIETGVYFPTYATLSKIFKALDLNIENIDFNLKQVHNSQYYLKIIQILNEVKDERLLKLYYNLLNEVQSGFYSISSK